MTSFWRELAATAAAGVVTFVVLTLLALVWKAISTGPRTPEEPPQ